MDVSEIDPQVTWGTSPEERRCRSPAVVPARSEGCDEVSVRPATRAGIYGHSTGHACRC